MACGIFFLLLLAGGVVWVLFRLHRAGQISREIFIGSLIVTGLGLVLFFAAIASDHHGPGRLFGMAFLLLLGFALFLLVRLVRLVIRWLIRSQLFGLQPAACPTVDRLKDFLIDRLPSVEHWKVAVHLERCPACQHRLEGLTAGQKSWPALAHKLTPPPPPEPALKQVIEKLKDVPEEQTRDEKPFAAELPLGFLSPSDKPGQLGRLDRYEVLAEIGRGGMGVVLKAFDPSLHRVVAIKVLAPQLATSGVARKRFLREAKAAAAVTHDHIVTIHAVEESNGLPYLVMQYVAGPSLQERIDKEGPLEVTEIVRIGMETASGLAAAHSHGIVHRDVKPGNILLEDGVQRVKLTDFGLARAMDDASLTQSGFVAGSPLFMAPEQARGEALDPRADLFSLGSVLYTLCTGRPPFRAANTLAVLRRVTEDTPRPIRETNPEVPEWLAALVDRLMAKEPDRRYQSAAEVVEMLGQRLAQLQHRAWVPPQAPPAPAANAAAGLPTSLTLCPSCGASLHVPESMVGGLVHCPECGKPFEPVNGSEVIQVARAILSPLKRGFRFWRKSPRWYGLAIAAVPLLFSLLLFGSLIVGGSSVSPPAPPTIAEAAPWPVSRPADPREPSYWKNTLAWLPARATLFGAIDLGGIGPLTLDDPWTRMALRLLVPRETSVQLTPENLGRIRLDGVALAYYDGPKPGEERALVHLQGLALDGHVPIVQYLSRATGKEVGIDQLEWDKERYRISSPELPFALGFYDDNHAFLARSLKKGAGPGQHLAVLGQVQGFGPAVPMPPGDLLTGSKAPWIKDELRLVPTDVRALCIGEIPREWRQTLSEALELRECPRTFVATLRQEGDSAVVAVSLWMDRAGTVPTLLADLAKWSRQGLDRLQARDPRWRQDPSALAMVSQTLKNIRWGKNEKGDGVRTSVRIPGPVWKALKNVLLRATQVDNPE